MNKIEYLKLKNMLEKYFRQERYIDEQFIYDAIEIVMKSRKFEFLIEDIKILTESDEKGMTGSYSPLDKDIKIVLPHQMAEIFDYNTTLMHILLHELEHVEQHKVCLERKNYDLKTSLLSVCFAANTNLESVMKRISSEDIKPNEMGPILQKLEYYEKYSEAINKNCYELLPSERQAEINSFYYLIKLLKNLKTESNENKMIMIKVNYLIRKIMGYKEEGNIVLPPTYELYKNILELSGKPEEIEMYYKKFDYLSKKMSLEERLFYGLKISLDEFEKQKTVIGKILKNKNDHKSKKLLLDNI